MKELERELMRSLQALAQPAEVQRSLFPEFVVVADELVLDFGEALDLVRAQGIKHWSDSQRLALDLLDREISAHSGPDFPDVWLAADSLSHATWDRFRNLATSALFAFNWPVVPPAPGGAIYVGSG